MKILDKPILKF